MIEIVIYLLKVTLIQGVFFLIYWLLFRNTVFHSPNRFFLLASISLSFLIPFIELPDFQSNVPEVVQESPIVFWLYDPVIQHEYILEPIQSGNKFSMASILTWVYILITLVLIARSALYLIALQKLKKKSESIKKRWFTLFKTTQTRSFSFFNNVFVPKTLFGSDAFDQVLAHECVHVRRFHSLDRLLLDFVVSLFWFNPFIYLYRNALIEIHEYEADEGVLKQYNDPISYQEVLFSQLQTSEYSGLVSHFNFQMIKKRIVMMNKQKKRTGWIYALTLPVTLMVIFAFSTKEVMKPLNEMGDEISSFIGPIGEVDLVNQTFQQDDKVPSILPFKESDNIRFTSGYGMRVHPVEKKKKMHHGADFSCPLGTEVIATADGTVTMIQNKESGHGKMVVIDHGNGYKTRYAQLSQFKVRQGSKVKKGDVVALSGSSGASTGPHLHYEVIKDGRSEDPERYIKNYKFTKEHGLKKTLQEGVYSPNKSKQELIEKEQELVRKEEELELRESELAIATAQLAEIELARAEEELTRVRKMELEARKMEEKHRELLQEQKQQERDLSQIEVRGSKGGDPLYVLDREIIETDLGKSISQDNIKSITILKGEKAKADYGNEGENGVIIIKSKGTKTKIKTRKK